VPKETATRRKNQVTSEEDWRLIIMLVVDEVWLFLSAPEG
jgi:hypothetical protein